ncbi:hypothetical protein BL253_05230 [Pseudofrankia asymbiotica]|uniref:Secreted protein n=1 Tax=Pseudofrankia asymbiotica TaxID=1834516 RepID=A0A1V2IGY8_9ACTN|nr:hypothetical protein BL253_05230 [Pseudofrankia asymbiotica]
MEYRKGRRYSLVVAAAVLGSVLSVAPAAVAAEAPSHVGKAAAGCFWRHDPGHWGWENGHRAWIPARSVWVCAGGGRR